MIVLPWPDIPYSEEYRANVVPAARPARNAQLAPEAAADVSNWRGEHCRDLGRDQYRHACGRRIGNQSMGRHTIYRLALPVREDAALRDGYHDSRNQGHHP